MTHSDTTLCHTARHPFKHCDTVNPPVYHASTILFDRVDDVRESGGEGYGEFTYARIGTPTSRALEDAVATLENGFRSVAVASGVEAVAIALMAVTKQGDHVLIPDSAYGPSRMFAREVLQDRYGLEVTFYPADCGTSIADYIQSNTTAIYIESPGSNTFVMQDIRAIVGVAQQRKIITLMDNTWASPLYCKPLDLGVDISIQAATKYICGHSDVMMGLITAKDEAVFYRVKRMAYLLGACCGPDDVYLAIRGLRTMAVRLERHYESTLKLAEWIQTRDEVEAVHYPPLPSDPGHALWQRDFTGGNSLFSITLKSRAASKIKAMLDGYALFGIGFSWGGFESLVMPSGLTALQQADDSAIMEGQIVRYHVGLEHVDDLQKDLEIGFARLAA